MCSNDILRIIRITYCCNIENARALNLEIKFAKLKIILLNSLQKFAKNSEYEDKIII